jgi:hypothetical protein
MIRSLDAVDSRPASWQWQTFCKAGESITLSYRVKNTQFGIRQGNSLPYDLGELGYGYCVRRDSQGLPNDLETVV